MVEKMNRKKMISYFSDFTQKFVDLKELMRVVDIEMDRLYPSISNVLDEAFIGSCSEKGIQRYEKMMGITSNPSDTLDQRRSKILLNLDTDRTYTYLWILKNLDQYCGPGNYDIDKSLEDYRLDISVYEGNVNALEAFFESVLPVNIAYDIHVSAKHIGYAQAGIIWQNDEVFTLKEAVI